MVSVSISEIKAMETQVAAQKDAPIRVLVVDDYVILAPGNTPDAE